jgi:hypothetical protein
LGEALEDTAFGPTGGQADAVAVEKPGGWLVQALPKADSMYELKVAKKGKPASAARAIFSTGDGELMGRVRLLRLPSFQYPL